MNIITKRKNIEKRIEKLNSLLNKEEEKLRLLKKSCHHINVINQWIDGDYYSKGYTNHLCKDCGLEW